MDSETNRGPGEAPPVLLRERLVGIALFLLTFAFFFVKAPSYAVPGRSAGILVTFTGMDPFGPLVRPFWTGLMHLLAFLPIRNLGAAANIVSALLGATVCWLLYSIVRLMPYIRLFRRKGRRQMERDQRMVAGIMAALFAASSFQLMTVSTRADYMVLDMVAMLLPFLPAMIYLQRQQPSLLLISCLFFGLGLVEYPGMAFILPGFVAWWLYLLWKSEWPKTSTLVLAGCLLASGLLVLLLYILAFTGSQAAILRELTGGTAALIEFIRLYYSQLVQGVPKVGWMLIFGVNLLPFYLVVVREMEAPTEKLSALGAYAFRLVLILLAVATLLRLPGSPDHLLGGRVFLLAPLLVVAGWSGFLVGYHYGLFMQKNKAWAAYALVALWSVLILFAGVRHAGQTRTAPLEPVVEFAQHVVEHLDGRIFLVTEGQLDSSLRLAARRAGVAAHLINLRFGQSLPHARYHASLFQDDELKNLALLGTEALLRGWMARDAAAADQIAVLAYPAPVETRGLRAFPTGLFYVMRPEDGTFDRGAAFRRVEPLWERWPRQAPREEDTDAAARFALESTFRWLSRQANDLGVLLEEADFSESAQIAYRRSIEYWEDNASATLNLLDLSRRTGRQDSIPELREILRAQAERARTSFQMEHLNRFCGQIRRPLGMLQELSALGVAAETQREEIAEELDADDMGALLVMARIHLQEGDLDESMGLFRRVLTRDRNNLDALHGIFRVSLLKQELGVAERLLQQMEQIAGDTTRFLVERADWLRASGRTDEAYNFLLQASRHPWAPSYVWFSLAQLAAQREDEAVFGQAIAALERDRNYLPGMYMLGVQAQGGNRLAEARSYYDRALSLNPTHVPSLVNLLRIDYHERNAESLRRHAAALIAVDPDHAFGNYMSAYVHIDAGRTDLAEAALRRSLEQDVVPGAHNELAWILFRRNQLDEALPHALNAVALEPNVPTHQYTLGRIQWAQGERESGIASIEAALEAGGARSVHILLGATDVFLNAGRTEQAKALIELLAANRDQLSTEHRTELIALEARISMQ